jgi:predicted permease
LGLAIAKVAVSVLVSLVSGVQHRIELQPQFNTRVLAFTTVVALITGFLFSLTPALHATSNRGAAPLAGPRDRTATARSRAGRALVVLQIALSLILLSGAALFVRTLHNLLTLDPGFSRESIVMLSVDGRPSRRPWREDPRGQRTEAWQVWSALLIRASALPGVTSASAATLSPLGGHDRGVRLAVIGGAPGPVADMGIHLNHVSAHYFTTMGMDLRRGRPFDDRDRDGAPRVAILNETAARGYFGDADPLGRRITFPGQVIQDEYEIVGVVRDVRYDNLRTADERMAFVPIAQSIDRISRVQLAVRSAMPVRGLADALRQAVQTTVSGGFPGDALTMEQQVEESLLQERLVSLLASIFGGLALILACIGLYGVLAYTVAGRTREIGIRIAIGARRLEVIWLVLRETIVLMVLAIALGLPIVLWSATYVASALFGVEPRDPLALGAAVASLLTVAAAAAFLPARRASRIDPMIALRHE